MLYIAVKSEATRPVREAAHAVPLPSQDCCCGFFISIHALF